MRRPAARVVTFGLDAPRRTDDDLGCSRCAGEHWLAHGRDAAPAGRDTAGRGPAQRRQRARRRGARVARSACRSRRSPTRCATFAGLPHRVERVAEIDGVTLLRRLQGHQRRRHGRRAVGLAPAARRQRQGGADRRRRRQGAGLRAAAPARSPGARARRGADRPRRAGDRAGARRRPVPPLERAASMQDAVARAFEPARPATPCCCRRRARASTCSATTTIAARCSAPR